MDDRVGAVEARAALVLRRRRQLLREFVRRTGSWNEAEELVAELTLRALEELPLEPAACLAWLARESESLLRRRRYGRRRRPDSLEMELAGERLAGSEDTEAAALDGLTGELITAALGRLPAADQALLRPLLAGLTMAELARRLGISRYVLRARLRVAREKLRRLLPADLLAELSPPRGGRSGAP